MPLEFKKESILINETITKKKSEIEVNVDIIVPDSKPDILKVLQIDGDAVLTNKEAQKDRVLVSGIANFTILYLPDGEDQSVKSIVSSVNFSNIIDANGITPDMVAMANCDLMNIEFSLLNCRKMSIKGIISVDVAVSAQNTLEYVSEITGDIKTEIKKTPIKAYTLAAYGENEIQIVDKLDVPQGKPDIYEVLKIDASIRENDFKIISNKIIAKGNLCVTTLYSGEGQLNFMEHEIPFTEILDLAGISENMISNINYNLQKIDYELLENSDGENRVLGISADISVICQAYEEVAVDAVTDAYCPGYKLDVTKNNMRINSIIASKQDQILIKEIVSLPESTSRISQIYNVVAKPFVENCVFDGSRMKIEGYVDTYILYLTDDPDTPIYSAKEEVDFVHYIDINDTGSDIVCEADPRINHLSYTLNQAGEVELRINLDISAKAIKENPASICTDVEIVGEASNADRPSILIYFASKDEDSWDVAKKYNVSVADILRANNLSEGDIIKAGTKLLIPR